MKILYRTLILSLFIVVCLNSYSLPAKPGVVKAEQPDGSEVRISLEGNAFQKRIFSEDGNLLTTDSAGYYVYADADFEGNPVATGIRYRGVAELSSQEIEKISSLNLQNIKESYLRKSENESVGTRGPGLGLSKFPNLGEFPSVVILVEFSDKQFSLDDPKDFYSRMLNEPGFSDMGATGSAKDYFVINSSGQFVPTFDVYGPVELPKPYSYYGRNGYWGSDEAPYEMVIEACELLDEEIDFSIYDCNGDGLIDNVYFFYAGYGEADGGGANTIWPHSWDITQITRDPYYFDGVRLDHYACSNELQHLDEFLPDGIGTFCHEFSHVLGLPDLYSTSYNGAFTPYTWDILDHGSYNNLSRTPPNYSAYERYALDWLIPEELTVGEYSLEEIGESNSALIVSTENENEYFLIENRQLVGFDAYLPGHGMLIWHIEFDWRKWMANTVNNTPAHQNIDLIEADNKKTKTTFAGDSFPGTDNVTEFSCQTRPAFKNWDDEPMPLRIFEISETPEGLITFIVEECEEAGVEEITAIEGSLEIDGNHLSAIGRWEIYNLSGLKIAEVENGSLEIASGLYIAKGKETTKKIFIP